MLTPAPDTENVQLRSDDGQAHVTLKPDHTIRLENPGGFINLTAAGELSMNALTKIALDAPMIQISGDQVDVLGTATVNIMANALALVFNAMSGGTISGSEGTVDMSNLELLIKEMIADGKAFTPHIHKLPGNMGVTEGPQ